MPAKNSKQLIHPPFLSHSYNGLGHNSPSTGTVSMVQFISLLKCFWTPNKQLNKTLIFTYVSFTDWHRKDQDSLWFSHGVGGKSEHWEKLRQGSILCWFCYCASRFLPRTWRRGSHRNCCILFAIWSLCFRVMPDSRKYNVLFVQWSPEGLRSYFPSWHMYFSCKPFHVPKNFIFQFSNCYESVKLQGGGGGEWVRISSRLTWSKAAVITVFIRMASHFSPHCSCPCFSAFTPAPNFSFYCQLIFSKALASILYISKYAARLYNYQKDSSLWIFFCFHTNGISYALNEQVHCTISRRHQGRPLCVW